MDYLRFLNNCSSTKLPQNPIHFEPDFLLLNNYIESVVPFLKTISENDYEKVIKIINRDNLLPIKNELLSLFEGFKLKFEAIRFAWENDWILEKRTNILLSDLRKVREFIINSPDPPLKGVVREKVKLTREHEVNGKTVTTSITLNSIDIFERTTELLVNHYSEYFEALIIKPITYNPQSPYIKVINNTRGIVNLINDNCKTVNGNKIPKSQIYNFLNDFFKLAGLHENLKDYFDSRQNEVEVIEKWLSKKA